MRPDCISAEERLSAKEQESKNRGSWRLIPSLDITAVLEELNRGQLYIYTLFELGIISETDTTTLLQIIQEDPKVLHLFVSYASASNIRITDAELYHEFIRQHPCSSVRPHSLYSENYPVQAITGVLLELEKKAMLTRVEYAMLYRRCASHSVVLEHCYSIFSKEKDEAEFVRSVRVAIELYDLLKGRSQPMKADHARIMQYIIDHRLLSEEEVEWMLREYSEGNEVLLNSLDVCSETQDVEGLVVLLHNVMGMLISYQLNAEVQEYLGVLVREMLASGVVTQAQAERLLGLLQEPDECMRGLYEEYRHSGDFEGLVNALVVMGEAVVEEGEAVTETEPEMKLPDKEEVVEVIEAMRGELCDEAVERLLALLGGGDVRIVVEVRVARACKA